MRNRVLSAAGPARRRRRRIARRAPPCDAAPNRERQVATLSGYSLFELSRQRIISSTPLRREGTPEDIAKAVHFLLADSPYITGETISVDGGRHVSI